METVLIHRETTDGALGPLAHAANNARDIRALRVWMDRAGISSGPLFRAVTEGGKPRARRLYSVTVADVVKEYVRACGKDPAQYAGHSLRAGLVTSAAIAGAPEWSIMKQTGHQSSEMLRRYIRDSALFRDNPAARVGL